MNPYSEGAGSQSIFFVSFQTALSAEQSSAQVQHNGLFKLLYRVEQKVVPGWEDTSALSKPDWYLTIYSLFMHNPVDAKKRQYTAVQSSKDG